MPSSSNPDFGALAALWGAEKFPQLQIVDDSHKGLAVKFYTREGNWTASIRDYTSQANRDSNVCIWNGRPGYNPQWMNVADPNLFDYFEKFITESIPFSQKLR
jgi:hypothetical protein